MRTTSVGWKWVCGAAGVLLSAFAFAHGAATTTAAELNLAPAAQASASYVSGDTTVDALHNEDSPRSSRDNRRRSYGNWPRRGAQWVEFSWPQAITTNASEVYWWDDRQGVRAPASARILSWDGNDFVEVAGSAELGVERDRFNRVAFSDVTTNRLRLEMTGDGEFSTGVLEWRVFDSGSSPAFPPRVKAGVDRVVVLGGKTYLDGEVRGIGSAPVHTTWSKTDGPGDVQFGDAASLSTTAAFSAPGVYTLSLKAAVDQLTSESTLTVKVTTAPTASPLSPVATGRYRVTSPLWRERVKSLIVSWIPYCYQRMSDPNLREGGINNFEETAKKLAGKPAAAHRGYPFANAWVYNTVESMCLALQIDAAGDSAIEAAQQEMRTKLEDWIPKIVAAQEPDGYLQTAFTLSGNPRWTLRGDHEGYVAGYFIDAALVHYEMTKRQDDRLYQAARRLGDCWYENIGPSPKRTWYNGHQAMEMSLVRLGQFVNVAEGDGAGDKYIALAKFLLDSRRDGSEYDQSHVPVVKQYEAVGHAVRAVYSYAGMADIVLATGDVDYLSAAESLWDNIVNKKYYVTGGIGSGETSEGFGPNYSLRHNGYCESCSSCGEIFFQHKLNLLRGDAKYADLYEETLYNALLGSMDLAGANFYYQNPLDAAGPRYPWHGCPCCVGNIPRTLLALPTWAYVKNNDSLYVNLYIGCETVVDDVAGSPVAISQETNYPWDGDVSITIDPGESRKFALRLRMPRRDVSELYEAAPQADGISNLTVNGKPFEIVADQGYAVVDRTWTKGDVVAFAIPMQVQRVHGAEAIEATQGQVALRYGPLMYSLESVDQSLDGALDSDAAVTPEWIPDLLGGVVVLKGKFADGTPLFAIPNYARNNRLAQPTRESATEGGPDTAPVPTGTRRRGRGGRSVIWIREAN
ncbi:MAG: glycoside hydrolase family 127 protein [Planctomycetales bacterium]|nr:glycoside hydrolase family 127 protein [Planctomycetales bacterium]